jgi:hypothetical protein
VPEKDANLGKWNSPVGMSVGLFYNQSTEPLVVKSVSLLNPHNLILHAAEVYEMIRYSNPIAAVAPWPQEGDHVPKSEWNMRQPVPGASVRQRTGCSLPPISRSIILMCMSSPLKYLMHHPLADGLQEKVIKYQAGVNSCTFTLMEGLAIGGALQPAAASCKQPLAAIKAAFASS